MSLKTKGAFMPQELKNKKWKPVGGNNAEKELIMPSSFTQHEAYNGTPKTLTPK